MKRKQQIKRNKGRREENEMKETRREDERR